MDRPETVDTTSSAFCPAEFDHHSPSHARDWAGDFLRMREACPRAKSEAHGGFWVASTYDDVLGIAQSAESFTAQKTFDPDTGRAEGGLAIPPFPSPPAKPSETESPEWDRLRSFLNSRFAPKAVERHRAEARRLAAALVDRFIETGRFDIVDDLTNPLPALVTMRFFGFPLDDWSVFAEAIHKLVYVPQTDPEFMTAIQGVEHFRQRVEEEVLLRREEPRDDLLGHFAAGEIEGRPLDMELIKNMAFNILAGGVDTTTALTSNTLLHLSRHPEQRQRLIEEPELLPRACEEFVRYFTPLHALGRTAKADVSVNGWQFQKGDRVLLAYASANRDPAIFDDPEAVRLDRAPNRHVGFGAGMHRCLGSFIARIMFQAMMSEVLTRLPDFQVVEAEIEPYPSVGNVNGWIHIPATFTPGPKVGESVV
jgi:cytochrome P450